MPIQCDNLLTIGGVITIGGFIGLLGVFLITRVIAAAWFRTKAEYMQRGQ